MGQAPAGAAASMARRVIPAVLVALLAGSNGLLFVWDRNARSERDEALRDVDAAHRATSEAVALEKSRSVAVSGELAKARADLAAAEERVRSSEASGASDQKRLVAERDDAKKKAAALADRLGEVEAERDRIKKHADEVDELMKLLDEKKVNVRRLAGLEGPPREDVEVVSVDERRVPPVLVLRADTLEGFEAGDKLYVLRSGDGGKRREAGHVVVEKVDRARGLLSATVGKLAAGEKIAVGEKLATYPP